MPRPKLPAAQRKVLTMTVRMRQDLDEGLAAVALLRGTTKSGLVSQYSAEQIRLEREHDQHCFDAAVKEIKRRRKAQRAKKSARARFKSPSDSSDYSRVNTEQRRLARVERPKASRHDRSIGTLSDGAEKTIHVGIGIPSLLSRRTKASCDGPETDSNDISLTANRPE